MITPNLPQGPQKPLPAHWQLPEPASTFAPEHDSLYTFVEWINYIFFFGIVLVLFYAVIKYRRRTPDQEPASTITHHTALEVTWTVIPLIVVMVIFAWGWKGYSDMALAPADALLYSVQAERWKWSFKHPGSTELVVHDVWVPVDTPVQLTMSSNDVLHSFFIPAFRVKRDVLPGRVQTVWFKATRTTWDENDADRMSKGFHIFCTEYCGEGHSKMMGKVHVVSKADWEKYTQPGADQPWSPWTGDLEKNGRIVYQQNCSACHSLDGSKGTGPSFKGLWARNAKRLGVAGTADEEEKVSAYVLESVRDPNKFIAEGFKPPSAMTPFPESGLNEDRVADIIAFLQSAELK